MPRPRKNFNRAKRNRNIKPLWFSKRKFDKMKLVVRDGKKCAYCGDDTSALEIEHIIPRSRGGVDKIQNLALSCRKCNMAKGNKLPHEIEDNYFRGRVLQVRQHANSKKY